MTRHIDPDIVELVATLNIDDPVQAISVENSLQAKRDQARRREAHRAAAADPSLAGRVLTMRLGTSVAILAIAFAVACVAVVIWATSR